MASEKTIGRIQAQIQRRAAHCLQHEVADPRASLITITRVELSSDLTHAKIWYSVLGDDTVNSKTQHMLDHAAGFIQRRVASVLRMRRVPRMDWIYDSSIADAARLDTLIQESLTRDAQIRGEEHSIPDPQGAWNKKEADDQYDGDPDDDDLDDEFLDDDAR
ncbi:MAG: 30S ribosome-binding factor RbfA [Planctomycetes bacterium]|nr:30S ribosome-binding factor RbfA [Planctomycetota bacterium]